MYSIEINLLNDRPEFSQELTPSYGGGGGDSKAPLLLGFAVAGGALGLVMFSYGILSFLNQQLVSQEQSLDAELSQLAPQVNEIAALQAEEKTVREETQALATIFNQIKPWSSMLQDLSDRVPSTLQLTKIEQIAAQTSSNNNNRRNQPSSAQEPPEEGASPSIPVSRLKLTGKAVTFDNINDFVLTLRKSPFLVGENTKLNSSEREQAQFQANAEGIRLVEHEIDTEINTVPASDLLQALNTTGASGLVARINMLKQKGVIQP